MAAYVVDSDHPALGRLFELYDELERARRAFRKNRVTTGSMGQMVVSPLALWISRLAAQCVPLEDRFGLNPQARLKLGVQLGEAKRSLEDINRDMAAGEPDDEGVPLEVVDVDAREA